MVKSFARLDGIITLIDAKHIEQHLDEQKSEGAENEAVEQVAFADRLLLNKTDLVTEDDLVRIEKRLRSMNAAAEIVRCTKADVKVESVLNIGTSYLSIYRYPQICLSCSSKLSIGPHSCLDKHKTNSCCLMQCEVSTSVFEPEQASTPIVLFTVVSASTPIVLFTVVSVVSCLQNQSLLYLLFSELLDFRSFRSAEDFGIRPSVPQHRWRAPARHQREQCEHYRAWRA